MENHYRLHTDHALLKLLNLRDNLLTFKQVGDETLEEMWLKFQAVLSPCPSHGMTDKVLLECFYKSLGLENRSNANQLFTGCVLCQPYEVVEKTLDGMVEANKETKKEKDWNTLVTKLDALSNRVLALEVQAMEREKHVILQECRNGKNHGSARDDEVLTLIQQKIAEQNKRLNEMKDNMEMLNEVSTSNSMTIQLQDAQISHLMTGRYPLFAEDSPNYTMGDSEHEE